MDNKIVYLNQKFNRSTESLIGVRCTLVTAAGIFTGTISAIDQNFTYELQDVIFRPNGAINTQIKMKICEIYGSHIIASLPLLEPLE